MFFPLGISEHYRSIMTVSESLWGGFLFSIAGAAIATIGALLFAGTAGESLLASTFGAAIASVVGGFVHIRNAYPSAFQKHRTRSDA